MSALVGKPAPDFCAKAVVDCQVVDSFTLSQFKGNKYVLLFFYPKDFTFVCPTEIVSFQENLKAFEDRGVQVIACSTDSEYSHLAWVNASKNDGGIKGVTFPIVADTNKTIAENYGVLAGKKYYDAEGLAQVEGELVALRGLFVIDKQGIVQHALVNNFGIGRSTEEALRIVDAILHFEKFGEVCPANWHKGGKALKATHESISEFLSEK